MIICGCWILNGFFHFSSLSLTHTHTFNFWNIRAEKIKELMAKMPQMLADYRKERKEQKLAKTKKSPIDEVLQYKRVVEREERKEKRLSQKSTQKKKK